MVSEGPHPGIILHWFLESQEEVKAAAAIGCYFSANSAMPDDSLSLIPPDRVLPETDYPVTARKGVRQPGDVSTLESRLAALYGEPPQVVRRRFYHNLRTIAMVSGTIDRLPNHLVDRLLAL